MAVKTQKKRANPRQRNSIHSSERNGCSSSSTIFIKTPPVYLTSVGQNQNVCFTFSSAYYCNPKSTWHARTDPHCVDRERRRDASHVVDVRTSSYTALIFLSCIFAVVRRKILTSSYILDFLGSARLPLATKYITASSKTRTSTTRLQLRTPTRYSSFLID